MHMIDFNGADFSNINTYDIMIKIFPNILDKSWHKNNTGYNILEM